jgi:predicted Zn finger-like uncharacterized protein
MSLLTRCPRCRTLFRVTPAQLQARSGTVRCGRCMNAFDAYQALAPEQGNTLASPAPAVMPEPAPAAAAQPPVPQSPSAPAASAPPGLAPVPTRATAAVTERVAQPQLTPAPAAATPDAPPGPTLVERILRKPSSAQRWYGAAVALGIVLALQLAFGYRSELSARYTTMRSVFTAICDRLGCSVILPQRPDLVRIEASDVHMTDSSRPQLIQLTATLRSYASYDLAYPALDLVLTNANEHALARRIFTPDEYLDQSRDPLAGISANAEITVALDLDTGNLNAAGFRLDLLPAPAP